MNHKCPLCLQPVSKSLYERITGIWKEKEKHLEALREKEKTLLKKEKRLQEKFAKEKESIQKTEAKKYKIQLLEQKNRDKREEAKKVKELSKTLRAQSMDDAKTRYRKRENELEKKERLAKDRYSKLTTQFVTMQTKTRQQLEQRDRKILSLEEQIKANKTPQVLGLLQEEVFLKELQENFPTDKYEHTGKGGDIIHRITEGDKEIGLLVYELKKVSSFNKEHITQTLEAKQLRKADYGILITNAKMKNTVGFKITQGIIIIHPTGSIALITLLRNHILTLSKLKLTKELRNKQIEAILNYVQSPAFKNGIESIIQETISLYKGLENEAKKHIDGWRQRFKSYKNINVNARSIQGRAINLLLESDSKGVLSGKEEILPINLQEKIE